MEPYSEKVMEHFKNPRNVGEIPDANGIGNVGNPVCATPKTLIFTNPGVKEIQDVLEGNRVLSHDGHYHEAIRLHKRSYKGLVYSITVNNLGTTYLTPEHHIFAIKTGKRDKFRLLGESIPDWYCAQELKKGDLILYPIPQETKNINTIDFDIEKPKWDFKSKVLPQKVKVDKGLCRLIGYYLAEGYVRTDKCKGTVGFVFGAHEKTYIKEVIDLMQKTFNIKAAQLMHSHNGTATDIAFYSARLARFFEKQFGKGAQNKRLPFWAMQLSKDKQREILCGLWRGDGYIDLKRQRAKYVTISRQLAYQLRPLLLRQKIIGNFSKCKAYGIHKESFLYYIQDDESLKKIIKIIGLGLTIKPASLKICKSCFNNNFYYTTIRDIRPLQYNGLVYNLEVEGAHSYVSNALTLHNCGDIMRMYLKIENGVIVDAKFKTYGCGAAVATSSMVTEMVKGKTVDEALKISNRAVAEALGGLPAIKMHCSVLAEDALRSALKDYYKRQGKEPPFKDEPHKHDEH